MADAVGRHGSDALERPVDRGAADTEELGQFGGAVGTQIVQLDEVSGLLDGELGLLPFQMTFRTGSFMPSRVRILIRSDSNSATIASTLNSSRPIGSFGSWIDPPRLSRTFFPVSSDKMSLALGSDRASRSSLVTTNVSPERHAARASRSPGRSRLVPSGRDRRRCGRHRHRAPEGRLVARSDLAVPLIRARIPPGVHSSPRHEPSDPVRQHCISEQSFDDSRLTVSTVSRTRVGANRRWRRREMCRPPPTNTPGGLPPA